MNKWLIELANQEFKGDIKAVLSECGLYGRKSSF